MCWLYSWLKRLSFNIKKSTCFWCCLCYKLVSGWVVFIYHSVWIFYREWCVARRHCGPYTVLIWRWWLTKNHFFLLNLCFLTSIELSAYLCVSFVPLCMYMNCQLRMIGRIKVCFMCVTHLLTLIYNVFQCSSCLVDEFCSTYKCVA